MSSSPMPPALERETEPIYAYGFAQYNGGRWEEAIDAFRLLCLKCPCEGRFWFALSAALQASGKYSEAIEGWAMTALLDIDNPYPHFYAAEVLFSLQRKEEAAQALQEACSKMTQEHPLQEKISLLREQWKV